MRKLLSILICSFLFASVQAQKMMGFTDTNAAKQTDWEKQFDAQLKASNLDEWMKFLSSHPKKIRFTEEMLLLSKL